MTYWCRIAFLAALFSWPLCDRECFTNPVSVDSQDSTQPEPRSNIGSHFSDRLPVRNSETGMRCDAIGIGGLDAWFGTPDARIRSAEGNTVLPWDDSEQEIESDSETILVEGKLKMLDKHMGQVVATAITHSFTEHHNHQSLDSMIFLDEYHIMILLYDCCQDVLLISDKMK